MCTLSGSVLLTEEDSQILYFSLKHSPILPSTPGPPNRSLKYCDTNVLCLFFVYQCFLRFFVDGFSTVALC